MIISIIQLKDENDAWKTVYTRPDYVDAETLHDRCIVEARTACVLNRWDYTYVRMVYATLTDELTLRIDNEDTFEYTFDHSDGEETMELADYIKQVRRDYSDGIGNPFK